MTKLREKMVEDLQLRGLAPSTQKAYVREVQHLAEHYRKSPDKITEDELREYFLYLVQIREVSPSTLRIALCGIKFFYQHTLQQEWITFDLIRPRKRKKLPVVLTTDEVCQVLSLVRRSQNRVCLSIIYACGLRIQEGAKLSVSDIDGERHMLHIRDGKGNKDRYVPLPVLALQLLRRHWCTHRNPVWLFPSPWGVKQQLWQSIQLHLGQHNDHLNMHYWQAVSKRRPRFIHCATLMGARSGVWLMHNSVQSVSRNRFSHPGDTEYQKALCWSASRGQERVVRGRPRPKRQTFRMIGKG